MRKRGRSLLTRTKYLSSNKGKTPRREWSGLTLSIIRSWSHAIGHLRRVSTWKTGYQRRRAPLSLHSCLENSLETHLRSHTPVGWPTKSQELTPTTQKINWGSRNSTRKVKSGRCRSKQICRLCPRQRIFHLMRTLRIAIKKAIWFLRKFFFLWQKRYMQQTQLKINKRQL